jgi:hypothetical protein
MLAEEVRDKVMHKLQGEVSQLEESCTFVPTTGNL